jgi:hypothetical protein
MDTLPPPPSRPRFIRSRLNARTPSPGLDVKTERFLPGNKLSKGRVPGATARRVKTYAEAIERSCPPETLARVIAKAVEHALTDSYLAHGARMFLARTIGIDRIHLYVNSAAPPSIPVYRLDLLTDDELQALDKLSAKMSIEGGSDE